MQKVSRMECFWCSKFCTGLVPATRAGTGFACAAPAPLGNLRDKFTHSLSLLMAERIVLGNPLLLPAVVPQTAPHQHNLTKFAIVIPRIRGTG